MEDNKLKRVRKIMETLNVGLITAKDIANKEEIKEDIERAETLEDIKKILLKEFKLT